MNRTIEFMARSTVTTMHPIPDGYKFKPAGRAQWLQRLAWRFLQWRGSLAQAYEPKCEIVRHTIEADTFIERILTQQHELMRGFNRDGQTLLIGGEDYAQMMCATEMRDHFFRFDARLGMGRQILGLNVQVIPWMRGMVVMP